VAEQHDVDQRRQLPKEHLAVQPQDDQRAVAPRDRDRQRDQGHHAGLPMSHLVGDSVQEGPTPVQIDDGRENRLDPSIAGKRQLLAET